MKNRITKMKRLFCRQSICVLISMAYLGYAGHTYGQINYSYGWESPDLGTWTTGGSGEDFENTGTTPCTGTGTAKANVYDGDISNLISGNLGTSDGSMLTLMYKYKVTEFDEIIAAPAASVNMRIQYGPSATGPWTTAQTIDGTNHVVSASCASQTVTFTPPAGSIYLRFRCIGVGSADLDYYIDDISASQGPPPSCVAPTNVAVSNVSAATANVSFAAPSSPPANGYDYYINTTNTAPTSFASFKTFLQYAQCNTHFTQLHITIYNLYFV